MINTWPGWENSGFIGEGSFGKVYKIKREEFGTGYDAALKVITIPASQSDVKAAYDEGMDEESVTKYFHSFVEDIVAEFALMSQMKGNSNIVSYEDHMVVQHEDEVAWDILIRMELLTTLTDYAKKNPLTENDIIRLGIHMARALEVCRNRNIIHRDIKPENIFVSKDGNFKLGDFGVARVAEKTISVMSRKGTYNYMAPEVYKGEEYSYTADIYSLGLVLYRFLNDNRIPFLPPFPTPIQYSDRENALNERMKGSKIPEPAHGSAEFKKIILKACAYDPKDRYATATDLRDALEDLVRSRRMTASVQEKVEKEDAKQEVKPEPVKEEAVEVAPVETETVEEDALEETAKAEPVKVKEVKAKPAKAEKVKENKAKVQEVSTTAAADVWWKKKWFGASLFAGVLLLGTLLFAWDTFYNIQAFFWRGRSFGYNNAYAAFRYAFRMTFVVSAPMILCAKCWSKLWIVDPKHAKWKRVLPCGLLLFLAFCIYPAINVVGNVINVVGCIISAPLVTFLGVATMIGIWILVFELKKTSHWEKRWMGMLLVCLTLFVEGVLLIHEVNSLWVETWLSSLPLEECRQASDTPYVVVISLFSIMFFGTALLLLGYLWTGKTKGCKTLWNIMMCIVVICSILPVWAFCQLIMNIACLPIPAIIGIVLGVGGVIGVNTFIQKKLVKKSVESEE